MKAQEKTPKIFWKYYDSFRRKQISLEEFSKKSGLEISKINQYLKENFSHIEK